MVYISSNAQINIVHDLQNKKWIKVHFNGMHCLKVYSIILYFLSWALK